MYTYKYPRPALTTDALVFGFDKEQKKLKILLIQRKNEPFKGKWALPGGFVDMDETVETCVSRELEEETGLKIKKFEQLITASKVDRDPRGRTVSVVFWTLINADYSAKGLDDASDANWFTITDLPELAFDHFDIIHFAINQLKFRLSEKELFTEFFSEISVDDLKI
ncbi:MAG: NUDIX hydrolase [Bacteroidales bacterium]|nr:NUDIX hydrolase [Bacteroidales bacterium]